MVRFITLLGISIASVLLSQIAHAEVFRTYDDFTGKTTISVTPNWENWNSFPTLYLNYSFQGKNPTQKPKFLFFTVIAPIRTYAECAKGVTGVIADSERVPTADENLLPSSRLNLPKIERLGRNNPSLKQYISLFSPYRFEDFQRIAAANGVVYQLCGDSSKVFTLTEEEQRDLRNYIKDITP